QTLVLHLERRERQWRLHTRSTLDGLEQVLVADAVLLTPPVPHALELIRGCEGGGAYELRNGLRRGWDGRLFALSAAFTGSSLLEPRGGVRIAGPPIEWVTDNHRRGVSPVGPTLTGLSAPDWTEQHWDESDEEVRDQLLPCISSWATGDSVEV